ncbi:hypothetical protein C8R46DRAFT_867321, partial [Mycena filopes]
LQLKIYLWHFSSAEFVHWRDSLEDADAGFRPFWTEPNLVYQNYDGDGATDLAEAS